MAGNSATFTFIGDAGELVTASRRADDALESVGAGANQAASDLDSAGQASQDATSKLGSIGSAVTGMTDAVDSAGAAFQGLVDIQNYSYERAAKLARAQADVEQALLDGRQAAIDLEQATVDLNQAQADGRQAGIDLEQSQIDITQSQLDAATALKDYNTAVKEHGANSAEARQAAIDLKQAQLDEKQAVEDGNQARIDANQALVDGKQYALDGAQALRDGKDAQLNLNDAMREANPTGLQQWADKLNLLTPILSGVVGILGLVTAAQWAWNSAVLANPLTWIIVAIVAVIAVIVVIAVKTDWFQRLWRAAWGGIKAAAQAVGNWFTSTLPKFFSSAWDRIKNVWSKVTGFFSNIKKGVVNVFSGIGDGIKNAFRSAFNYVARAWNNTVGRLSFTVPGWVPGIGGNSVQAPRLPTFHSGGIVPGVPGQEVMTILQAGERVTPRSSNVGSGGDVIWVNGDGVVDVLIRAIADRVGNKGGRAAQLGIRFVS